MHPTGRGRLSVMPDDLAELFARTLEGNYEDEKPWEAVRELHRLGSREVFERAAEWCKSSDPQKRSRGADVLAQLGKTAENPDVQFADEAFAMLSTLLLNDTAPQPMASAIAALGHLGNAGAVPIVAGFRSHASSEVRFDVAFALGCFPDDERAIPALIELMTDAVDDVRDWATFGLGVLGKSDSEAIRNALVRNLSDADLDTREEAMAGLAIRGDECVLGHLRKALRERPNADQLKEAACSLLGLSWEESDREGGALLSALDERFPDVAPRTED